MSTPYLSTHLPTEHTYTISIVTESTCTSKTHFSSKLPLNIVRYILDFNKPKTHTNFRKTCHGFRQVFPWVAHLYLKDTMMF
jgi:hypothetical protein